MPVGEEVGGGNGTGCSLEGKHSIDFFKRKERRKGSVKRQ